MAGIEKITHNDEILAVVIRADFNEPGVTFATPDEFPLQLGIHNQKKGKAVRPHVHNPIAELKNLNVQEMFQIIKGKIKVGLYSKEDKKVKEIILSEGDTVLLVAGHSVEFLEDTKLVEIKQGPYRGLSEEKRFIE